MRKITALQSVLLSLSVVQGANILGIWFHAGKSHHILGEVLFKELARRGHNVTMASPFPLKEPFPNYTDVFLTGIQEDQNSRSQIFLEMNKGGASTVVNVMLDLTRTQTELTLVHPEMKKLLESGVKFDVIITDWFLNFALLYFGKLFKAPVIPLASQGTVNIATVFTGNPDEPSYVPVLGLDLPVDMTFIQRTINGVFYVITNLIGKNNIRYHQNLIKKHFNDTMTDEEMRDAQALVLSNGHYAFESPRPYVPNIIPIGGFHVSQPKQLPKNFKDFLDTADNGAIFFSLGSNVKSTMLPTKTMQDILKVFSKLPYKIILKWEDEGMKNKPTNVLISKWCPQNDILVHPNIKLFISHGGMLSTIEAMYHAVPVLGIPIFGDQKINVPSAVKKGYAVQLELKDVNEENFSKAINEIMDNPKYRNVVTKLSFLLKDQPLPPLDTAVFWVEHVIRHKGGSHLKNYALNLAWYEYYMIDVVLFVASMIVIILAVGYFIIKRIVLFIVKKIYKNERDYKLKRN